MTLALSPQYANREEFLHSVEHVRKVGHGVAHWAMLLPAKRPDESFEESVQRFHAKVVERAVDVTLEGLMEILERPNLQFIIDAQGKPEMSEVQDVSAEVEAVTDAAAQHLIDALAAQRAADAPGLAANTDLTVSEAYDLGMRGSLVALDNIQAAVKFAQGENEVSILGGLAALFDGINS